eukprot:CAMPEP_0170486540 /NCGR_PEP_ID=MMETSP0208-20121228/5521_1 /TAXON_ID=197538 /ORGANISM="Strombidium inclinatum, Strain S3" /LENGTH=132 /DNA_ID=CAMNT_0010760505 /DNA_START=49 /DNA_END=447 /DNA_ORIENTATION=+
MLQQQLGFTPVYLVNLETVANTYTAEPGSNTVFDFKNGNPLADTKVGTFRKEAGANLDFVDASGKQQMGIVDKFQKTASSDLSSAKSNMGSAGLSTGFKNLGQATNNMFSVQGDRFNAVDKTMKTQFGLLML